MIQKQITAIQKPGASEHHSAISAYFWKDQSNPLGEWWDRMKMVNWILEDQDQHKAFVLDRRGDKAYCKVMKNQYGTYYLETYADGIHADNLLALPRY